jgi:hypothetical protein
VGVSLPYEKEVIRMELTQLEKEFIIVGLEELKKQLKPYWNDFMFLNKEGRKITEERYIECDKLLQKLNKQFNTNLDNIKIRWKDVSADSSHA